MSTHLDPLNPDLSLDVLAAELRLKHQSARQDAEALAQRLTQLFPHLSRTTYTGLFSKQLRTYTLALPESQYRLEFQGQHVIYQEQQISHGIVLATHHISQDEWISAILNHFQPTQS